MMIGTACYAQADNDKARREKQRQEKQLLRERAKDCKEDNRMARKALKDNSKETTRMNRTIDSRNTGERQPYDEPLNPVQGQMNANGNPTPLYNSTRNMNDGPRRSAIDTLKIR